MSIILRKRPRINKTALKWDFHTIYHSRKLSKIEKKKTKTQNTESKQFVIECACKKEKKESLIRWCYVQYMLYWYTYVQYILYWYAYGSKIHAERSYEIFIRLVRPFTDYYRLFHQCYNIKPHINYMDIFYTHNTQPTFFFHCFVYYIFFFILSSFHFLLVIRWLFYQMRCLFCCLVL